VLGFGDIAISMSGRHFRDAVPAAASGRERPTQRPKLPAESRIWARFSGLKLSPSIHILPRRFLHGVSGRPMRPSLPPGYHPSDDEEFMNPLQVEYFRQKLLQWRAQLLAESSDTLQHLKEESLLKPDLTDRASLETDRAIELRTRARERKLISKINAALHRIDDGTYGYCEETDEPIGIRRLEARPIATLSIEAQERHERMERTHRDD
jgi:DnaK suppressor protein